MKFFSSLLLFALASAPLLSAADPLTGFPFQNETLRYNVNWPGGNSIGNVTLTAAKSGDGWNFDMAANVNVPLVPIADRYRSSAAGFDLCSVTLDRLISHRLEAKKLSDRPSATMFPRVAMRQIVRRELFSLDRSLTFSVCIDENV